MWVEGGKYGSIDPCYPSKVAQAHIHNLLFHHHTDESKPLKYIFFPCSPTSRLRLDNVMDTASCPIVAGAPEVMKAGLHEGDRLLRRARHRVPRPGAVVHRAEPAAKRQLFEAWGQLLGITEDESDFACERGLEGARRSSTTDLQEKGRAILETVEAENRVAILLLGRPYHSDPGLNHGVLEEFQVLGYPILSIRSIPKDRGTWLNRFFAERPRGRAHRVAARDAATSGRRTTRPTPRRRCGAAKFAARHPNVVVLDLSSFKCGHDAPTYGLIDSIISDVGDAVLGAARHRREQAGRLDQDPRQDLRPLAEAARGAPRGRRHSATTS